MPEVKFEDNVGCCQVYGMLGEDASHSLTLMRLRLQLPHPARDF